MRCDHAVTYPSRATRRQVSTGAGISAAAVARVRSRPGVGVGRHPVAGKGQRAPLRAVRDDGSLRQRIVAVAVHETRDAESAAVLLTRTLTKRKVAPGLSPCAEHRTRGNADHPGIRRVEYRPWDARWRGTAPGGWRVSPVISCLNGLAGADNAIPLAPVLSLARCRSAQPSSPLRDRMHSRTRQSHWRTRCASAWNSGRRSGGVSLAARAQDLVVPFCRRPDTRQRHWLSTEAARNGAQRRAHASARQRRGRRPTCHATSAVGGACCLSPVRAPVRWAHHESLGQRHPGA